AAEKAPATEADIAAMRALVREAVEAGAIGFSSSRSLNHRASDGTVTYSYSAASDELAGIAMGVADAGTGVLQMISDFDDVDAEGGLIRGQVCGRPVGVMMALDFSRNPFLFCEAYREIAGLEPRAKLAALRDPERRRRILAEFAGFRDVEPFVLLSDFTKMY